MEKPLISIVMSVYKESEKCLRDAIESILNQTFKNFEFIIILDDPENDFLDTIIKEYMLKDKRIKYIRNKKNIGLASSLNKGIKLAKGKYIARMDADDISLPFRLSIQLKIIQKNKVDLVFSNVYFIDEKGDLIGHPKKFKSKKVNLLNLFLERILLFHPTLLAKKDVLKKIFTR